ncbi:MAG: Gfo/Idh/MocA family oxidoreductase [Sphingobacteriales bacterium]|nr:Gfo/Idh/MocA family oxidoreductase [Sphingobacteriales bacterium]OJV97640.1 MAG: glucose-fructose oxidoreductase [Sphingobacteriales bacterium 44-61]
MLPDNSKSHTRRKFINKVSAVALGSMLFGSYANARQDKKREVMNTKRTAGKLGIALVGLGKYSGGQLAPALQETEHCFLAGIVTGTPEKAKDWKSKYDIPDGNIYNYENFASIKDNPAIDIIYVVLPNALHAEYVIKAAAAGKHVICEKPMAINVEECDRMIDACKKTGVMLSIGYRLHFEPHTQEMIRLSKDKVVGKVKKIIAKDGMSKVEGWRLNKALAGGGPLMDVGIYCVQGACYVSGMDPIAVKAKEGPKTKPEMFRDIEQSLSWEMEFPDGTIAACESSYAEDMNLLHVDAEKGWFELSPAYSYRGITGKTSEGKIDLPGVTQQAGQMDDFAMAIKDKRATPVPGEMGRRDLKILMAIYKAMDSGQRVEIS